jgi:stage III sporulation protein AA
MEQKQILEAYIYPILPDDLTAPIKKFMDRTSGLLIEIRLRVNHPVLLVFSEEDVFLEPDMTCSREDINRSLQLMLKHSMYAYEQEIRAGYLTIYGGHRVGIAGQAIVEGHDVAAIKNIGSINIRIAREVIGCGEAIFPYLLNKFGRIRSTLLIAPPRCGKTTVLRDLIRIISTGTGSFFGTQVGVVDERSEIAACCQGVPAVNLGPRTDVLDGCPKAQGMLMLIRSMGPGVLATDELGRKEDVMAVREALNAGVSVLATAHGSNVTEIAARPFIQELIRDSCFSRYIILSNRPRIGTVKSIIAAKNYEFVFGNEVNDDD